jgi:uncharacterized membrane protein
MKRVKIDLAIWIIILASFGVGIYLYPDMPEKMASHWNARGEVDGYMQKGWALFLMPGITVLLYLMYLLIPRIDPLKKNIEKFRPYFDWFILLMIVFLAYIHGLSIATNLGYKFNMTTMILPALGVLFIYIGFLVEHAKRNWFIGIRTPWTLSDDRVWEKTHRLGGTLFKIAGVLVFLSFLFESVALWIVLGSALIAGLYPVVFSYFEYEKLKRQKH